tara:strand:+ start:1443 stop:1652 length:210 start_codon:yes stop_codon:yes gene_type:complete
MGKMKEVFMKERESENDKYVDESYFYNKWKVEQQEPKNYIGGDEDFVDFVDEVPPVVREYTDVDDSNEY